jgi:spore coat protein CotF|tara:strand:+ start:161 stop:307 length:147 start_codon:yes stop_codon:yes gene_type:complete
MKYLLLLLVLTACANKTFVMPTATTSPEERHVLVAYPVIPVITTTLED